MVQTSDFWVFWASYLGDTSMFGDDEIGRSLARPATLWTAAVDRKPNCYAAANRLRSRSVCHRAEYMVGLVGLGHSVRKLGSASCAAQEQKFGVLVYIFVHLAFER